MPNILSQEEVDALLRGISEGEVETEVVDKTITDGVVSYDLTSQDRIIRGRMPTLEMINEKFSRIFRGTMSQILRKVVNVSAVSTDMVKFGEFMNNLPVPTSMHLFKMEPLRGSALFVVESKVIFTLVDLLFGGSGTTPYKIEGREFTAIENNLIKKVVLDALADLELAWKAILELKITYLRSEVNPQFAQIVPPTDVVVVVNFEVELEYSTGVMSVCLPYASLEPVKEKLQTGYQSENMEVDKVWARRFKEYLMQAGLDIAVELGQTQISGKELLNLQKGDVIRLNHFSSDPLTASVEGIPKYRVEPGYHKGNMACRITELIAKEGINDGSE